MAAILRDVAVNSRQRTFSIDGCGPTYFENASKLQDVNQATDECLARRFATTFGDITGKDPTHEKILVKRVIGSPGDTVECCTSEGQLTRNGYPLDDRFVHQDFPFTPDESVCEGVIPSMRCFGPIDVSTGKYLVLADNRSNSSDGVAHCRGLTSADAPSCVRYVDETDLVDPVISVIWPVKNWKSL